MVVKLCIASGWEHRRFGRRNDHLSVGPMIQNSLRNRLTIVCTVAHEGLKRGDDLGEQIRYRALITDFWRGEFAGNNLMMFVDRKVDLAPGSASRSVVFLLMPFVFAVDLQSGGVNNHEATLELRGRSSGLHSVQVRGQIK